MNLDNVTVELRPRGEWEAVELGGRMVRRDARAIYRVWFALTLPAIALVFLITWFTNWGLIALLVYWWLEPLTDGPVLRIVSRRLFGEEPDVKATLRAFFTTAWQTRLYWLTPFRFHFARSAMLPITQLEGLGGKRRRDRAKTLGSRIFGHGFGITIVYQHLVLAVYVGLILLVFLLMPESLRTSHGSEWLELFADSNSKWSSVVSLLIFYAAQTILHPWFVGAGFGLYINCRTQLEAWDIEVAFRRMVQRRAALSASVSVVLCGLIVGLGAAEPGFAQEPMVQDQFEQEEDYSDPGFDGFWDDAEVQDAMQEVLQKEELQQFQTITDWQRIQQPEARSASQDWWVEPIRWVGTLLALIVEFALWILVGLLLVAIFWYRKRWLPYLVSSSNKSPTKPRVVLAGGEVRSEDLPADIPETALRLWKDGQQREALALLYRGSVFTLVAQHGIQLPKSATENMCVDAVGRGAEQQQSLLFRRIVEAWIQCAYASRDIDDRIVTELCHDWRAQYGAQR